MANSNIKSKPGHVSTKGHTHVSPKPELVGKKTIGNTCPTKGDCAPVKKNTCPTKDDCKTGPNCPTKVNMTPQKGGVKDCGGKRSC